MTESVYDYRRVFCAIWQKMRQAIPLDAQEYVIAQVIDCHPEYHDVLEQNALDACGPPDDLYYTDRPFLHLSLHVSLREQIQLDQPAGIQSLHTDFLQRCSDPHHAEHQMLAVMAQWMTAHSQGQALGDASAYLQALQRALPA